MKTATLKELRSRFTRISNWLNAGETVLILKDHAPYARIIPEGRRHGTLWGATPCLQPLPPDIDDPVPWSSEKPIAEKYSKFS